MDSIEYNYTIPVPKRQREARTSTFLETTQFQWWDLELNMPSTFIYVLRQAFS